MIHDLHYALRQLSRNRVFALVAVLSLALGIGTTAAVFSVVEGVLLNPYPYRGSDRMVVLSSATQSGPFNRLLSTTSEYADTIMRANSLDGGIFWDNWRMTTRNGGLPEFLNTGKLSPNAFEFFGTPPLLGTTFSGDSGGLTSQPTYPVVLSYRYWQTHYGGSPDAIGAVLQLDQQDYTIIGVMPEVFRFLDSDIYVPLIKPGGPYFTLARLRPGVAPDAATAELQALVRAEAQREGDPQWNDIRIRLTDMRVDAVGKLSGALGLLSGSVVFLLAIGCLNVSILLVARGIARQHELTVRVAIGASVQRLLRQLLTESLLLSVLGGIAGVALGYVFLGSILRWMPQDLVPREFPVRMNIEVLVFTGAVAILSGLLAGIWPAWRLSGCDYGLARHFQTRGAAGKAGAAHSHSLLIMAQIAMTVLLLAGSGATLHTVLELTRATLGYDPHDVIALGISLSDGAFMTWAERVAYYERLRASIASIPGVESVAVASATTLPPLVFGRSRVEIAGKSLPDNERVVMQTVSDDYFFTLRVPLLRGRVWTPAEALRAAHVAVINNTMARRYWPHQDAIGQTIRLGNLKKTSIFQLDSPNNDQRVQVIGVVGDSKNAGLHDPVAPAAYAPYTLLVSDGLPLLARTRGNQAAIVQEARRAIAQVNGNQPVGPTYTLDDRLRSVGWARQQFAASLFLLFTALALLLAAVGLYSVVACSVSWRTREFAVRAALGASRASIMVMVFRSFGLTVAFGFTGGLAATAFLNRLIARWTESSLWNPVSLVPAIGLLVGVAFIAIVIPARRAASSDPMGALHADS